MALPQPPPGSQPKIVQRLLVRTAGFMLVLAVLFGAYRWANEQHGDFDKGGDSVGVVSALRREANGQQAVLIRPDGSVVGTKSWKEGVTDREPVWSPDGRFLFFASDRKDSTFHIFRWNPTSDDAQPRTDKGGSRSNPTFAPGDTEMRPLIVAGGMVRELDPATYKTPQVLPPPNADVVQSGSGEEQGTDTSLSIYGGLGKSFRIARYLPGREAIAAVMRRDEGEVLIVQELKPVNDRVPKPKPLAAGDRIDFDIDATSGTIVFSIQNFRWVDRDQVPESFRKNNRILTPFRNMVGFIDPKAGGEQILGASPDDKSAFGAPRVSPDGTRVMLVGGSMVEGSLRPIGLLTMPLRAQGLQQASVLTRGEVYEPSWSADGKRIVFAKRAGGKRDVYTMNADGTEEKNLTQGKGDFATPLFSPMVKP